MAKENTKTIGFEGDATDLGKFERGNNYVLGIGIDEYELHPLNNCVRDVEMLTRVLVERYNFKSEHIKLLLNREATRQAIISTLREYAKTITADDNFILYYSGHGILDKTYNEGYWLVSGCDAKNYASDGLANQDVLLNIKALKARHVVLLIDSCFSGSFFYTTRDISESLSDVDELEKRPSRWAITAGRNEPVSDGQAGTHSPFAKYLLDYLRRDNHPDGRFTVSDLDQQIKRSVGPNSTQKPDGRPLHNAGHEGGAFVFRLKTDTKEQIAFKLAIEKRDIHLLEDFIDDYENSPLKPAAKKLLKELEVERDWAIALRKDTVAGYDDFIEDYPKDPHAEEARKRKNALRTARNREKTISEQPKEIIKPESKYQTASIQQKLPVNTPAESADVAANLIKIKEQAAAEHAKKDELSIQKSSHEYDLYFSFSPENLPEAKSIVETLRGYGLRVFFMDNYFNYREPLEMIRHALHNSTHFIWLCTPESASSPFVKAEYNDFVPEAMSSPDERKFFILQGTGFQINLVPLLYRSAIARIVENTEQIISDLLT